MIVILRQYQKSSAVTSNNTSVSVIHQSPASASVYNIHEWRYSDYPCRIRLFNKICISKLFISFIHGISLSMQLCYFFCSSHVMFNVHGIIVFVLLICIAFLSNGLRCNVCMFVPITVTFQSIIFIFIIIYIYFETSPICISFSCLSSIPVRILYFNMVVNILLF